MEFVGRSRAKSITVPRETFGIEFSPQDGGVHHPREQNAISRFQANIDGSVHVQLPNGRIFKSSTTSAVKKDILPFRSRGVFHVEHCFQLTSSRCHFDSFEH